MVCFEKVLSTKNMISIAVLVFIVYVIVSQKGKKSVSFMEDGVFVVLADWCGHCKKLKKSGELEKLKSNVSVQTYEYTDPQAKKIMESVGSTGFPTIAMCKNGITKNYNGERTHQKMFEYYTNM